VSFGYNLNYPEIPPHAHFGQIQASDKRLWAMCLPLITSVNKAYRNCLARYAPHVAQSGANYAGKLATFGYTENAILINMPN